MQHRTILLADDDCDDAETFREALHEADADALFFHAATGAEVFNALEGNVVRPDLIFLDLNMPVMNGWQCLARLKNTAPYDQIPVIMYTTSSNPRDYQIALDLNAHGLITKPSDPRLLTRLLRMILGSKDTVALAQSLKDAYLLTRE